ncbi:MAG: GAF domain-containing protein [Candidatus Lokiarchaeota archaeon]
MSKIDNVIKELEIKDKIITTFHENSDDRLFSKLLEIIIGTIECEFAMLGFVVKKQSLSKKLYKEDVWNKYMIKKKLQIFKYDKWLDDDTIWSRTISTGLPQISNDPLEIDGRETPIHRVLSIPIKFNTEIIGIITTIDKKSDYDTHDVEHLEQFLKYIAPYLHKYIENKRLSEELKIRIEEQKRNIKTNQVIDEVDQQILNVLSLNGREKISNMEEIVEDTKRSIDPQAATKSAEQESDSKAVSDKSLENH